MELTLTRLTVWTVRPTTAIYPFFIIYWNVILYDNSNTLEYIYLIHFSLFPKIQYNLYVRYQILFRLDLYDEILTHHYIYYNQYYITKYLNIQYVKELKTKNPETFQSGVILYITKIKQLAIGSRPVFNLWLIAKRTVVTPIVNI